MLLLNHIGCYALRKLVQNLLSAQEIGSKLAMRLGKWVQETSRGWTIYVGNNVGFGK